MGLSETFIRRGFAKGQYGIAIKSFDLHERHCKKSVPWEQLEEHKAQEHIQVKCGKCNKMMERRQLLDHETDECSERLQICEFCQLELPLSSLMEHSLSCGSRTERCSDCGRYVKLKEQLHHAQICCSTPPTLKKPSPEDASDTNAGLRPLLPICKRQGC
ncbi:LOW QUALITY PROTEIN: XIAP-associated factor 1 [Xyrauchen texanus]|uniref:LOW QUALITY PROTEIN: XIAP-associated factor 1 n=1 Tax=Xyrauchen texanus TaxID=154827 RepID=UPI002241A422|nr:LOW QUALITY PROTEIN: XIAP-associated factor 1 [Xyrauchen texanus]